MASDGFDPNGTNKNNRGSIHITTFSLLSSKNSNDPKLSGPIELTSYSPVLVNTFSLHTIANEKK